MTTEKETSAPDASAASYDPTAKHKGAGKTAAGSAPRTRAKTAAKAAPARKTAPKRKTP